ncbi:HD domain-containing phosphohydrolase [Pelomonas sp. KK5]|uniref:HD domain-containing phosphohydrolase n=1 Tax=Pelomonas sp. KK5 TaxID=1855730 RepID=UPI00097BF422|nr:HD domain-containing phosphohydrolase [Pelomonas sp. KK5]
MKTPTYQPRSIYVTLSVIMIGMVLLLYAALAGYQLQAGKRRMLTQAADTFERVGREAVAAIEGELRPARITAELLARTPLLADGEPSARLAELPLMAGALHANPSLEAVFGGTAQGSFLLLRRLDSEAQRQVFKAPAGTAYLLQSVDRSGAAGSLGRYRFYAADLALLETREQPDYDFDPRIRPWFELAVERGGGAVQTAPYLFFTTGQVGLTLAAASAQGRAAAGVDVSLRALSEMLAKQRITPSAELMIVDARGAVLAYAGLSPKPAASTSSKGERRLPMADEIGSPVLQQVWSAARDPQAALPPLLEVEDREWVVRVEPLVDAAAPGAGPQLRLAIAAPRDELQADALRNRRASVFITAGIVLLMLPIVHWAANLVSKPLKQLSREARTIRRFDFSGPDPGRSMIWEVDQLAMSMAGMKHTLQQFLEISSALSAERHFPTLLDRILQETIAVSQANAGALHLLSADGRLLEPVATRLRDSKGDSSVLQTLRVDEADSVSVSVLALQRDGTVESEIEWSDPRHLAAYGSLFSRLQTSRLRLLALPLKNRRNEVIGTLSLSFEAAERGSVRQGLAPARVAFVEALSGTAAVAIDNQQLLRAQKDLLESFIRLVAGAIDAKSPYTGAHCQRVPELTKMLAEAACAATEGPYADFQLGEDEWEALHIASWLHDCGKVTTPEFVVDKATKLQTIHDRIHEVRMRFEVLKRDSLLQRYEQELGAEEVERLRQDLAPLHAQLDEEFAFVAGCNEGGEYLSPEKIGRLREIGGRSWTRTLDDRLGVSHDERRRKDAAGPPAALPAQERLLADKPEQVFERPPSELLPEGFSVQQPEHLYNRGELYNLSISRGTLTTEERYKINDHIVQTIRMLEELPFPRHLKRVPEIAGGHHEKMDGSGYPKGLTRDTMSAEARMMAIADVFEALTADDRPYKKGKTLSEAMQIMGRMRDGDHIDPELFELFLRSGVWLRYARRFMRQEQIDDVDITDYLDGAAIPAQAATG